MQKEQTKELVGQATPEQIAEWKKQHKGGIYSIEVGGHVGYFKNPNRHEMNMSMSKADSDAALDMYDALAKVTKIGGSDEVLVNDQMFYGLVQQLKVKMEGEKANLVNL